MAGVDQCVITVDALTDHVDFELARGDDPRRIGPQGLGRQSQRFGRDGRPTVGGRDGLGLAQAKRLAVGSSTLRRDVAAWPKNTIWPLPAAIRTVGTARW